MNNNKFWEQFYRHEHISEPSAFAKSLHLSGKKILDMGCGNGRDSLFLAKTNVVVGIDQCDGWDKTLKNPMWVNNSIEDFIIRDTKEFNVLYMRFLLHAINSELQHDILKWAFKNMQDVYIECRSDKGEQPDNTHDRRLIKSKWLLKECIWIGYDVQYFEENTGFAKYKNEDPTIIRLHLTK